MRLAACAVTPMSWLTDLLKDYPAVAVAMERVAPVEERLRLAEADDGKLRADAAELRKDLDAARRGLGAQQKLETIVDDAGAPWKPDGAGTPVPYRPRCQAAVAVRVAPGSSAHFQMTAKVYCSACNYVAPFKPNEIDAIAARVAVMIRGNAP